MTFYAVCGLIILFLWFIASMSFCLKIYAVSGLNLCGFAVSPTPCTPFFGFEISIFLDA